MTHHELLQQQYEDALFALLMDEVAATEGRKALLENEALKNDPAAAVPEETMQRCRKIIIQGFRKQKMTAARRVGRRILHIAAIIVVICALGLSTAIAVSPAARKAVLNLAIQTLETDISMGFREDEMHTELSEMIPGWKPLGFGLVDKGKTSAYVWRMYGNTDGAYITVKRINKEQASLSIDSETPNVEVINVQGNTGFLVEKDGELQVSFADEKTAVTVDFLAEGVSRDELILFAENLTYKN